MNFANCTTQNIDWTNEHGTFTRPDVERYLPVASTSRELIDQWRRVGSVLSDIVGYAFKNQLPLRPDGSRWSLSNIAQPEKLALSLAALVLVGATDMVSVIVRGTLIQVATPDEMRGRISSVNNIFIGTSNEFGALESGLTAAFFGPVISVVGGGIGTILVVLGVAARWPQVRKIGALDRTLR